MYRCREHKSYKSGIDMIYIIKCICGWESYFNSSYYTKKQVLKIANAHKSYHSITTKHILIIEENSKEITRWIIK